MQYIPVQNEPSKVEIQKALFYGENPLEFTTQSGETIFAHILKVAREDGSLESWIIEGSLKKESDPEQKRSFSGWFHTRKRKGTFKLS